ncbi:MAG: NAD(P)H-dependent oxidoreductase subunit E [Chitinivibrionia bacterium]|nr:NAD(P)H-dependent oxidoreductase subunit E [Chitinivibrionia bacterium]
MEKHTAATIAFDEEREARFQRTLRAYPEKGAALLPALWLAQEQFGSLSDDVLAYVASRLECAPVKAFAVAEFYTMYKRERVGRFHLQLCRNLTCSLMGSEKLRAFIENAVGIQPGGRTPDGLFSLELVECLGSCGTAPVLRVNDTYFENITIERMKAILENCRKGTLPDPESL